MPIKVGDNAPDFTLFDFDKKSHTLKEFLGKNTVLAFYPGAFTGVCTKEMCALQDSMARLNSLNAHVVGISVDSPFANKAFATQNKLQFLLLSDYDRSVSTTYAGIYKDFGIPGYTAAKRSVFVLDKGGKVAYAWISEIPGTEPNYEEITSALTALK
ncbi:MAG TPA: peroxiredoxin [Bacteroidota bacterium]|nr:peroxiredoxin [Bacteroidota bacterium]